MEKQPRVHIEIVDSHQQREEPYAADQFPMILLGTLRDFIGTAVSKSPYQENIRPIVYISECDTLDLECEEVLTRDISGRMIFLA